MTDALESARLDDAAREEASSALASILLEAPAGSGKTAVLTRRLLRLLCAVDDPGEILAITFTRKAAAEMRARVVRALRGEVTEPEPAASELRALAEKALVHTAARGFRIAEEPQTLRIQTIDAFNYWLAAQLPVASRAGGALNVTDSATPLYHRAARRTLLSAESDPELAPHAQLLFERLDNHWLHLERLIAEMLAERGHWLRFVAGEDPRELCRRVSASLGSLARERLRALGSLVPESLRLRARWLPGCEGLAGEGENLTPWQRLSRLVLTKDDWRRQLGAHRLGPEFADPIACRRLRDLIDALRALPGAREALLDVKRAPGAQLTAEDASAIEALAHVLSRAAAELHAEFASAQRVDHTYVTGAARAALTEGGEPTDLALRAGMALRHILVDEFQDTSLAQFELLEVLTAGWEPGDGRTLFVVGDPMQSIYRFRDAEVGLFLRARESGIGRLTLKSLRLSRNFRAAHELVDFTNELFSGIFPALDDLRTGAVRYHASIPARAEASEPPRAGRVSLELFPDDRLAEARALASRVADLRAREPRASVAVLVVAHVHAVAVIAALESRGLPVLGVDLVPLPERPVVRDLVQLARALCDLADRSAWLAVLRAPWCGARLRTLTALSAPDDRELLFEALASADRLARSDPADLPRLARLREVLGDALALRPAASFTDWLEATWIRLGASDAYRADELEDAQAFFAALAERAAAREWRGPEDFASLLALLYSAPAGGENPVQVMTIHRAKGLEFDHVLIPSLERATRGAERRLLRWINVPGETGESELLIAPTTAVASSEPGELDAYLRELVRRRDANERCRLFYVAVTRARHTLWLSAAPTLAADGTVKPDRRSPLALLWPALAMRFNAAARRPAPGAVAGAAAGTAAARRVPLTRLAADWRAAPLPELVPLVQLPPAHLAAEPPEFSWVGERQRHIGTVVHALFAQLAESHPLPAGEALTEWRDRAARLLRREGVPAGDLAEASGIVITAVARTLSDARGRWILGGQHPEAASELALTGLADGRLRAVVIDRSFVDESGTRWVIDYKTSRHEGGGLEDFLAEELERYRGQLSTYVALARQLGPQPVRAALYFPLLSAFQELMESGE